MTDLSAQLQAALGAGYTIERELGGGGMSRVFVARDETLGRPVVVKVLSPERAATLSAERFTRETRLAAALQEPHIVPVLAAGTTAGGLPYYTMPFVQGDTLRSRMQAGPVPLNEAIGVLLDIAQALAYAHAQGVVHRDIKPENVLLSSGTAVVTDFGIAKAISASSDVETGNTLTSVGTSLGTPAYMAPEQAVGDRSTGAPADIYAWGVLAFELLAGVHPFVQCTTSQMLVAAHIAQSPPDLARTGNGSRASGALTSLVMACLEKEPSARPASAIALVEALRAVRTFDDATTVTRDDPAPGRLDHASRGSSPRRSRGAVFAIAALALALVAVLWGRKAVVRTPAVTEANALAVLPFADLSADGANAHLGDGVAETLLNALAKVPGLSVPARTSAFSFRGRDRDLQEIGRQLGVSAVLTGSIQRIGDRVRITARAVRVANDSILWSETYDRSVDEIFAVQDEVARAVVAVLPGSLSLDASARDVGGTRNPEAYEAYLLGRYHWNRRTTDGMVRATAAFRAAIEQDSLYALAWSGLADAYSLSIPGEYNVPGATAENTLPMAVAAARRAIEIAPDLGAAHISLGEALAQQGKSAESLAALERGVQLEPSYATGRQWYSYELMSNRRFKQAVREMEAAHALDPLAHVITLSLAILYDGEERYAEAAPLYAQGLAQSPEAWYGWKGRFAHDLATGDLDAAAEALQMAARNPAGEKRSAVLRFLPLWLNESTREAATDSLIARGPVFAALPLARRLRDDSTFVAAFRRAAADPEQLDMGAAWYLYAFLGPSLRSDPRLLPVLRDLGYPSLDGATEP